MTTFPSIPTVHWNVTPGIYPATESQTMDGRVATMRHGRLETGRTWSAEFTLTKQQYYDVLEHFHKDQLGGLLPFQFTSTTLHASHTPAGYEWKYAGEPSAEDETSNYFRVSITFECVPIGPAAVIQGGRAVILIRPLEAGYIPVMNTPWANVQFLLLVTGNDGSTTIVDAGQYTKTVTTNDGKVSSALKFFGNNTLTTTQTAISPLCTVQDVYATTVPSVFTLEAWFFLAGTTTLTGITDALFWFGATDTPGRMGVMIEDGVIKLEQNAIGTWLTTTGYAPYNQPFHIAIIGKANDDVQVTLNGKSIGIAARPVGGFGNGSAIRVFGRKGCHVGQVRYSTADIYTVPFTPGLAPFSTA